MFILNSKLKNLWVDKNRIKYKRITGINETEQIPYETLLPRYLAWICVVLIVCLTIGLFVCFL